MSLEPKSIAEAKELAEMLAKSTLIPVDLQGKPSNVLLIILQGMELGFSPTQAMRSLSIIKGKVSTSADGLAALCLRRRDVCERLERVRETSEECVYIAQRVGKKPQEYSFTIEDAKKAGLTGSGMYDKFRAQMLRARCITRACRAEFPDLCAGLYDSDTGELTDGKGATLGSETASDTATEPQQAALASPRGDMAEVQAERSAPSEFDLLRADIEGCSTLDDLIKLVPRIRKLSKDEQDALRPAYTKRNGDLQGSVVKP